MADPKDKEEKIPYEPPRLFDLGGGVAHAGDQCNVGGSPVGRCKAGSIATGGTCKAGNIAAATKKCKAGGLATQKCQAGGTR